MAVKVLDNQDKINEFLAQRVPLDNGEDGYVFSFASSEKAPGKGRYICHVCSTELAGTASLLQHGRGKNHNKKMASTQFFPHEQFTKIVMKESAVNSDMGRVVTAPGVEIVDLAPGEPVPPGFEDVVKRVPEIQETLERIKAPLIGLEYIVEITKEGEEAKYFCLMCDKKGDPRTVLSHLISFNHRIRYISKYFPKTFSAFNAIPKVRENRRGTTEVLSNIARAIEQNFGRLQPVIFNCEKFENAREQIFADVSSGKHFHESPNACYEKIVDMEMVKKYSNDWKSQLNYDKEVEEVKNVKSIFDSHKEEVEPFLELPPSEPSSAKAPRREDRTFREKYRHRGDSPEAKRPRIVRSSMSPVSSISSDGLSSSPDEPLRRSSSRSRRVHSRRSPSRSPYSSTRYRESRYKRSRSRSPPYRLKRFTSPVRFPRRTRSRSRTRSPPVSYGSRTGGRTWAPIRPISLRKKESSPVKKPYATESSDRAEKNRKYQTYYQALKTEMSSKLKSYEKTPEKHPKYSEEWKKFWNRRYKELVAEGKDASKHDFKPEWIKFWTLRMKELNEEEIEGRLKTFRDSIGLTELGQKKEGSPIEEEDDDIIEITPQVKVINGGGLRKQSVEKEQGGETDVIHVLGILAALETQLGSLGPRVNGLLAQALALEKTRKTSANSLLDIADNCVLFETAKEKLKGQLFADIVESHLKRATRKAVETIVEMMSAHEERKKQLQKEIDMKTREYTEKKVEPPPVDPLVVPGIGAVDKMAIAQQITAALVAQGKTDVTEEELEQLIAAVVGAAEDKEPLPVEEKKETPTNMLQQLLSSVVSTQKAKTERNEEPELSEQDLTTLLQTFKDLTREEQQFLIAHLKKLEARDPESVEKLRKYIVVEKLKSPIVIDESPERRKRLSPFSQREETANPAPSFKSAPPVRIDDDDDDYSFDDIALAARKNVKEIKRKNKEAKKEKKKGVAIDPDDLMLETKSALERSDKVSQLPLLMESAPAVQEQPPQPPAYVYDSGFNQNYYGEPYAQPQQYEFPTEHASVGYRGYEQWNTGYNQQPPAIDPYATNGYEQYQYGNYPPQQDPNQYQGYY